MLLDSARIYTFLIRIINQPERADGPDADKIRFVITTSAYLHTSLLVNDCS